MSGSSYDFDKAFDRLQRGCPGSLAAYLSVVKSDLPIAGTMAKFHCYMLAFDGNKRPRVTDLAVFLNDNMVDYALPRSQIAAAQEKDRLHNTTMYTSRLRRKAKTLFTALKKTGEGGEMLLYLLAQHMLGIPQVLCKMSLKTDGAIHFQGVDGLHMCYDHDHGELALYWGESKLYQSANDAVTDCLDSLKPYLVKNDDKAGERDLYLFRDYIDLGDDELAEKLLEYLDPDNPKYNKLQFRGICLIGFDDSRYPLGPNSKAEEFVLQELEEASRSWQNKLAGKIVERSPLESFILEVFVVPLPSVQEFRDAFLKEIKDA